MTSRLLLGLGIVAVMAPGCTRGTSTNNGLSISIPYLQETAQRIKDATSTACIHRIMVNVTGSQISPPIAPFIWQSSNSNSSSGCTPPPDSATTLNFTVPTGSPVLVQAMVITQDSSTGVQKFLYASQTTTPSTAGGTVTLTVAPLAENAGQGQIIGRFLETSDSVGRTGKVNLVYAPPGEPGMVLDSEEIFGGWLNVFSPRRRETILCV